ncbi:MAG: UDP-N-acetylmuramate--L-alanine ligase [Acidobacteria bacterium]|nr:UDP-N-acetylmuramate--L-alanine ligase [Acidobacteriota bacterium]
MFFQARRVHFIGIGGSGMSGIAEVLVNLRYEVSGSDQKLSAVTERLQSLGAKIWEGHQARHVDGAEAVVVSSAVTADNPEVIEARRRQIPVIPRGEMLAELMRLKFGIAIAGSHGKTTTTSMVAAVLGAAHMDPTLVVGGKLNSVGSSAHLGKGDFMVVESDESDRSFLLLAPILAVITNIDHEHLDHYGTFGNLMNAYAEFANKVPFYGADIVCIADENVRAMLPALRRRIITYGAPDADLAASKVTCGHHESRFSLRRKDLDLGEFNLRIPGEHNVLNAMAAVAVGLELNVPIETIRAGLSEFGGVERRFQLRGEEAGVAVVDDYGHHPTEIRATLRAAKQCSYRRVIVVFQPHRYTRSAALMDEFAACFADCDALFVLDIYGAGEPAIEGITASKIVERIRAVSQPQAQSNVEYAPSVPALMDRLAAFTQPGDLVLTLGAGNVWQVGEELLTRLRSRNQATVTTMSVSQEVSKAK